METCERGSKHNWLKKSEMRENIIQLSMRVFMLRHVSKRVSIAGIIGHTNISWERVSLQYS